MSEIAMKRRVIYNEYLSRYDDRSGNWMDAAFSFVWNNAKLIECATLTARVEELEQENAKLLDEVEVRRFTDERTDKLLDELEAENKRLEEALNTIHKRIMGYEPDNRIEARFFGELKIIARKALANKAE